jgi:hypothetical protein
LRLRQPDFFNAETTGTQLVLLNLYMPALTFSTADILKRIRRLP